MTEAPDNIARYVEVIKDDKRDDWILIKDRATDKIYLVNGDNREDCIFVLSAMNAADKSSDRIVA